MRIYTIKYATDAALHRLLLDRLNEQMNISAVDLGNISTIKYDKQKRIFPKSVLSAQLNISLKYYLSKGHV